MAHYIDKDALVAEIEKKIKNLYPKGGQGMVVTKILKDHYEDLLSLLDAHEAKEVDLKKEPASEDLEQAAIDYDSCRPALYGEDDEGDYVEYIEVRKDAFIAGAQWQKEQMMKDAVKGLIADNYLDVIKLRRPLSDDKYKAFQSVKVIIIKE